MKIFKGAALALAAIVLPTPSFAECRVPSQLSPILAEIRQITPIRLGSICGGKHAPRSYHYRNLAVDFRAFKNIGAVANYLRKNVPGSHHYGGGLFHIDTGPRRPWR